LRDRPRRYLLVSVGTIFRTDTYVDNIVDRTSKDISDLAKTFTNHRAVNLILNFEKYVFGIHKGKALGCLVSTKGIEANPDNAGKALVEM
jgi:hypothetical protein